MLREDGPMLTHAIGALLPSAVGVALSPLPIVAVILMLGTDRARSNGPAFALGWIVGLVIVSVIVLLVTGDADQPNSTASTSINWLEVGLGVVFLAMAGREWRSRPKHGEENEMPKWLRTVDSLTPAKSLGLGVGLSAINPKNLALTVAAVASIAQAGLSGSESALAVAVFVVIASASVAGPVLFYLLATDRAVGPLASLKTFMSRHNAVIVIVVLLILGAKLLGQGLGGVAT
jgi:threonine/homoserine/homoserine lactone efflux protein